MTTHTPDELLKIAAMDMAEAERLMVTQQYDPNTVLQLMTRLASSQAQSLLAIGQLVHQLVHKHPVEDVTTGGMFSPDMADQPGVLDPYTEALRMADEVIRGEDARTPQERWQRLVDVVSNF